MELLGADVRTSERAGANKPGPVFPCGQLSLLVVIIESALLIQS